MTINSIKKITNTCALTFDTDWAPPELVYKIIEILKDRKIPATFFSTSPYNIEDSEFIEIALHPNLMSDSTQGNNENDILDNLLSWHPNAQGIRTHRLYWRKELGNLFVRKGLKYDSSIFSFLQPGLHPIVEGRLLRLPIWWSDRSHVLNKIGFSPNDLPIHDKGLKIFDFHPIHIFLNTNSIEKYESTRKILHPMENNSLQNIERHASQKNGIKSFFFRFLDYIYTSKLDPIKLKDIYSSFKSDNC